LSPGRYLYRLKQIDVDGSFKYSKSVEIEIERPREYRLYQNYPNPFNPSTTISYSIPSTSHVSLKIFNVIGREVEILVDKELFAGTYSHVWDATKMTSGLYFCRLQSGLFSETKKLLIMR
jgi:hypothetical protein